MRLLSDRPIKHVPACVLATILTLAGTPRSVAAASGWGAGEGLTFAVRIAGLEVGRASVSIGEPGQLDGKRAILIHSRAEAVSLIKSLLSGYEDVVSTIDLSTLTPIKTKLTVHRGGNTRTVLTRHLKGKVEQEVTKGTHTRRRVYSLTEVSHDPMSALLSLRNRTFRRGQREHLYLVNGTKLFRYDFKTSTTDVPIRVGRHRYKTIRVSGVLEPVGWKRKKPPAKLTVWLSADARRIPLRVRTPGPIGNIELELSGYRPPKTAIPNSAVQL